MNPARIERTTNRWLLTQYASTRLAPFSGGERSTAELRVQIFIVTIALFRVLFKVCNGTKKGKWGSEALKEKLFVAFRVFSFFFLLEKVGRSTVFFQMRMPLPSPPPPWHAAIARALERGSSTPSSRYLQIATVRPDGRPAVRSVVFRGWFDFADGVVDGAASSSGSWAAAAAATTTTPRLGFVTDAR